MDLRVAGIAEVDPRMLLSGLQGRSAVPSAAGRRWGFGLGAAGLAVVLLVGLGPRPRVAGRWVEPSIPADVDAWLASEERGVPQLKPGEAKSVVWFDPATRARTPVSLVYLHGFSADRHEIEPLVSELAQDLGANVYFSRLTGHAQDGEALADATTDDWLADAAEAVAVGSKIGERVVLVGTSTGGTLALWAAAQPEAAGRVHALVLISPNVGLRDRRAEMLLWPWGGLIARIVEGPERCFEPHNEAEAMHWTICYPVRALVPMMAVVGEERSLDLASVRVPTLVFYSERDVLVDPAAIERTVGALGGHTRSLQVNDSADPAQHILAGEIMSPSTTERLRTEINAFLRSELR
jgi:esterase/lipase